MSVKPTVHMQCTLVSFKEHQISANWQWCWAKGLKRENEGYLAIHWGLYL